MLEEGGREKDRNPSGLKASGGAARLGFFSNEQLEDFRRQIAEWPEKTRADLMHKLTCLLLIEDLLNARGLLGSTGLAKGVSGYVSDLASSEFTEAFKRFQDGRHEG